MIFVSVAAIHILFITVQINESLIHFICVNLSFDSLQRLESLKAL